MNEPRNEKPAAPNTAKVALDEISQVRTLYFRGSVDVPTEQQITRISIVERKDKPRYEITYLPRIDKYHVRAFTPAQSDRPDDPKKLTHAFRIPGDWAIAEIEATP